MYKIIVANGIILNEKHEILVVKDEKAFGLPGGLIKLGENDIQALSRELMEELNLELINSRLLKYYDYPKALQEDLPLQMRVYIAETKGIPQIKDDITELVWLNKDVYTSRNDFPKLWWDVIFHDLQNQGLIDLY